MWICRGPGGHVDADKIWSPNVRAWAQQQQDRQAEVLPYLILKTADDKILMGWLASQTDMLAIDWDLLDPL